MSALNLRVYKGQCTISYGSECDYDICDSSYLVGNQHVDLTLGILTLILENNLIKVCTNSKYPQELQFTLENFSIETIRSFIRLSLVINKYVDEIQTDRTFAFGIKAPEERNCQSVEILAPKDAESLQSSETNNIV